MAEYKRKKIKSKKSKSTKNRKTDKDIKSEIMPKPEKKPKKRIKKKEIVTEENVNFEDNISLEENNEPLKIIKGNKGKHFKRIINISLSAVIIIAVIISAFVFLPCNIIETVKFGIYSMGNGGYPIDYSAAIIEDLVQNGSYYYVLTDTSIFVYSKNGKEIYSFSHGFSNPILTTSSTRAIVYEQSGNTYLIFNPDGLIYTGKTDNKIITAAIGMNGAYAIVTDSTEYTSTVTVFSKSNKNIYAWNSAKDIINSVCISPFSKKIAIGCLNSSGGEFVSKLYVLDFKSADPKFSLDFEGKLIYSLRATFGGFAVINSEKYSYFDWDNYERNDVFSADRSVDFFRTIGNKTLVVFNRDNDKTDNCCKLISSSGKTKTEVNFKGIITDIAYLNGKIYIVSDTKLSVYDKEGKPINSGPCEYGADRIAVIGSKEIAVVSSEGIKTSEINKEE